jgi:YD repeat-containing protein
MTTTDHGQGTRFIEEVLDDAVRGRRRFWRDDAGLTVRVQMADGATLEVHRDDADGVFGVTTGDGSPLLTLAAPVAIPAALRAMGLTPAQAAEIDGTHRLAATDRSGTTRTELRERTIRVEREGAVLRIDADDDGRPRRVTTPGFDDLVCCWTDGRWQIGLLDGPLLLTIAESPDRTDFAARSATADLSWSEAQLDTGQRWSDRDEIPLVETDLDMAGKVSHRTWHDGRSIGYSRDEHGRLIEWAETLSGTDTARTTVHARQYTGNELSGTLSNGVRTVVRSDGAGRIRKLIGPMRTVSYEYDANGRRVSRACRGHLTTYTYDPLGQLTCVTTPEGTVEYGWDALGRRISVTALGTEYREHRDTTGRLWSVTTAAGEPVCRFLWWNGRAVARCDADDAIDEIYLTDPFGTLLGVASATTDWCFRDAMQPPFGQVDAGIGWRPTLFGHIADDYTPLICFGGRELDPETGSFLTPDPWHGDPDDPRLLAGHSPASLPKEVPANGIHAYALSQYDPLGRPDRDGHFAVFNFVLTLMLGPTWGATLTSLSLFLFAPLNFYGEVIGLLGYIGGRHAWPQHSIFGLRAVTGSSRLGTMGLALNGFVPRGFAGVNEDRCITIGYVAWESRHYFRQLDRPRVLELDDISGTPKPDGKPSLDARRFSSNSGGSIVAITGTDRDRRKRVYASWWTRGPGNAVSVRNGAQTFEDQVKPGDPHARGTIFLAQPMPESMPAPSSNSDTETLTVDEYTVTQSSTAEFVPEVWFAVDVEANSGVAAGTVLGVSAGPLASAYGAVLTVVPGAEPVAVLDHELPQRFKNRRGLRNSVTLQKLTVSAVTSNGWTSRPGAAKPNQMIDLVAPPHPVAVGDVFRCAPTGGAPAGRPDAYTAVESVSLAITVSPTLGATAVAGATLYRLAPDGTATNAAYPGPPGNPAQLTFAREQPFAVDELVQVVAGAVTRYGRVTAVAEPVAAGPPGAGGAPGTPATPASITLDEPLTGLPAGAVKVARLKETNRDIDKGAGVTQAGDVLTVKVASTALFTANQPVLIDRAPRLVREVSTIGTVGVDTVDELIGTGPFTLTKYTPDGSTIGTKMSSSRFLKWISGPAPASYGTWPSAIMGLVPAASDPDRQPSGWRFFLQCNPRPADMHPEFGDYWQPATVAGVDYWLLSSELKITRTGNNFYFEPDADDHPRRYRLNIAPPDPITGASRLDVKGFLKTAVTRPDAGGGRVFAFPAEAQVPEAPRARWSLGDSLADHELTHTLQNTWWGPILGALPLQGAFRTVRDVLVANNIDLDNDAPEWMMHPFGGGFADMNVFEVLSIGGLMQIIWSFVILGPALPDADARRAILSTNFDDWSSVFSPVNHLIIDAIPKVQDDVPESKDWKVVLGRALTRALDMKAWTPFIGFIKLMLPDGPRNFLEQQASRKSGNLYSTLLSVDDKFSARLALAPNMTNANVTKQLGGVARLMSYADGYQSRTTALARCDADGSHLMTFNDTFGWGAAAGILQFKPAAGALLPADLYEPVGAAPVPRIVVDGPTIGGTPTTTELLDVPANTLMQPRLQAIVPIPPRVWQALGCYLVPAGPAVWSATAPDAFPHPAADDAHTAEAKITVKSRVTLGSDDVPWSNPPATGVAPTGPKIARFVTEKQALTVSGHKTIGWEAAGENGVTVTPRPAGGGWDLAVDPPTPGVALPTDVRVRIWSPVRRTDATLFDLDHPDVPTLSGTRSYLEKDIWIPVRDFLITVTDLPALPAGGAPATMTANGSYDLDLPIKVAGPPSIVVAGALLRAGRDSDLPPRGERWKFTVSGDRFVEAPQTVHVVVRFGPGVERPFDITVNPNFTLDAATFDVTQAAPLALTINGGAAPFTVVDQPPAASRATVAIAGTTATVTIAAPPPVPPGGPAPGPVAPITWKLKIRDGAGNLGARTITLHP